MTSICILANVNSCSCSLYVVVRPSVCLSVVCLSSVTFVHHTQAIEIFNNVSAPCNTLVTWQHPGKILRRSSQGNTSVGGLNQRVVEKCSDFGTLRRYISETVHIGGKLLLITNRKSHMGFRLVPNSVTLNDLERRNRPNGWVISPHSVAFLEDCVKWLKIHGYYLRQKCRPKNEVFSDILLTAILPGDHP